jgi:hypothetical protein
MLFTYRHKDRMSEPVRDAVDGFGTERAMLVVGLCKSFRKSRPYWPGGMLP